ncbi:hypothetical protein Tco_1352314 [Tanacetum coccineum]
MAETMEKYMSKTRADYGSGVAKPKIEDKDNFELKCQFLKELRDNTFSAIQAQLNNLRREIKKVNEKVYAAQVGYEQCKGPHYTKDCPLKEEGKTLEEAYYTQFGAPFQGEGYRATAPGFYQRNNVNPSYQERRKSMEDTMRKFMSESAKRHEENSNLIKEIRASTDAAIRNQGASIKTLEIQIGQMSKVLQERGFRSLPSSTETNLRDHVKSISTIVEADTSSIRRIGSHQYAIRMDHMDRNFQKLTHMKLHISINPYLEKRKTQGVSLLPCFINNVCFNNALADLGADRHFAVLKDMDAYRDEGMGDAIFGEPFLRAVGINARRIEGMITIHNGNEEVTYQMVRSHPRTSLKEKKSTMLVENLRSGNFEVLES